jgi:hypothetical protein
VPRSVWHLARCEGALAKTTSNALPGSISRLPGKLGVGESI